MSHAYSRLHYHLVFSTKERKRLIVPEIKDRLHAYMNGIIFNLGGVVEEIGGVEDHVPSTVFLPAEVSARRRDPRPQSRFLRLGSRNVARAGCVRLAARLRHLHRE